MLNGSFKNNDTKRLQIHECFHECAQMKSVTIKNRTCYILKRQTIERKSCSITIYALEWSVLFICAILARDSNFNGFSKDVHTILTKLDVLYETEENF